MAEKEVDACELCAKYTQSLQPYWTTQEQQKYPRRKKVADVLHSRGFNIGIIVFAVTDACIVITVLLLEIEALRMEAGPKQDKLEHIKFYLECISLSIVSMFFIEIVVNIAAIGLKHFFTQWIEVLDLVVTTISLIMDALVIADHVSHQNVKNHNTEGGAVDILEAAAGLLVLFRLFRILRVVNATMLSLWTNFTDTEHKKMEELDHLRNQVNVLEKKLIENHIPYPTMEEFAAQE